MDLRDSIAIEKDRSIQYTARYLDKENKLPNQFPYFDSSISNQYNVDVGFSYYLPPELSSFTFYSQLPFVQFTV